MGVNTSKDGNEGEKKSRLGLGGSSDVDMGDSGFTDTGKSSSRNNNNNNNNNNNTGISSGHKLQTINSAFDCKSLLKKKNVEIVNILLDKGPTLSLEFLLFLKSQLAHNHINLRQFIEKINIIFYLSVDPKDVKQYLSSIYKERTCHQVWGPNGLFYRCKTCAVTPSSSICYDCFSAGPHEKEGHDYTSSFANYGGSCDCGMEDSWKPSGFCSTHTHSGPEEDPTINMRSDLLISTHLTIRCVLCIILELSNRKTMQSEFAHVSDSVSSQYTLELLTWIDGVARIGLAVSHVLCEELVYQTLKPHYVASSNCEPLKLSRPDDPVCYALPTQLQPPIATLIMLSDDEIYSKVVYLLMFLLCEHSFKVGFSRSYTRIYPQLAKPATIDAIYRYSPQVFSIGSVAAMFTRNYTPSFLDTTFDTLLAALSNGRERDSHAHSRLDRHHTAIASDIKMIVQTPTICHYILFEQRSLLKRYLSILRAANCAERYTRQTLTHVEYYHDDWINSFQLDAEFRDVSGELIGSIPADIQLETMLDLIHYCTNCILDMVDTEFTGSYLGVPVSNTDLFNGTTPVSLIFPLFRFYVQLIQKAMTIFGPTKLDLKTLFPQSVNLYRILTPFILAQVFVQQVNNSYWVRNNNDIVRRKAYVYDLIFKENDMSIIQTIASVVDINEFLIFASKEFGAFLPVEVKNEDHRNNHSFYHFMLFVIHIYQERSLMVSSEEHVKNALVHLLFGHNLPHSKIETMMNHFDESELVEKTLEEVATVEQHGDEPAIFKLKPQYWKQFNPYFPMYEPQGVEDSLVAYFDYKKSMKLRNPDSLPLPPPLAPLLEWNKQVGEIVHSDFVHYMVLPLLHAFTTRFFSGAPTDEIPEVMFAVNECLYFLVLSTNAMKPWKGDDHLPMEKLMHPESSFVSHKNSVLCILQKYQLKNSVVTSTFDILVEMLKQTHQNNLFLDKRDLICKAIDSLYSYHPDIQQLILERYPTFKQLDEQVKSSDEKMKGAKQRQAEIMAKFTQQQNKFMMTSMDSDDELDTNDQATCVLCLKGQYSKKDPLSVIAMYQYSTLITFSKIAVLTNLSQQLKKHCKDFLKYISFPQQRSQIDLLNYTSSLHMRCCGHHIHHDCFKHYMETLMHKASQLDSFEGDHIIRPLSGEFLCPMCRRVSNIIIPIVDNNNSNNSEHTNTTTTSTTDVNKERTSPTSNLSLSSGSSGSVNNSNNDNSDAENNRNSSESLSTSAGKEKMDSFDDITRNQLSNWFSSLVAKDKGKSSSVTKSDEHLFFFHELNRVAFKGGNVDTISPYFLCQLTARNIEFLEIATREIQHQYHQQPNQNNNNCNPQQQSPQFCIGADIFARDILTIKTLYKVFKDYIHQHKENKYRETTIDLFKGMSESILSIDPFGSFILFLSVLDSPSNFDIDVITNFSLDVFITQFIITKIYSGLEKKKKVPLIQLVLEFLDQLVTKPHEEQQMFYRDLLLHISPLLRCLCLSQHILFGKIATLNREDIIVKDKLFSLLGITSLETIVVKQRRNPLLSVWVNRLEKSAMPFIIMEPKRPTFIDLPNNYKDVFIKYLSVPCITCKTIPTKSAICLLCGHLICIDSTCCVINSTTEANKHMNVCGIYKVGVFLETKNPIVTIIRDYRESKMTKPYIDQYGEPDANLDRGKPLYRSDYNLQELWSFWISHCLEEKFLNSCTLHGRDY